MTSQQIFIDNLYIIGLPVFLENINNIEESKQLEITPLREFRLRLIENDLFLDILINCADTTVANAALEKMTKVYKNYVYGTDMPPGQPINSNQLFSNHTMTRKEVNFKDEAVRGTGNIPPTFE